MGGAENSDSLTGGDRAWGLAVSFETDLAAYLNTDAQLVGLVGAKIGPDAEDRAGNPPYLVYTVLNERRPLTLTEATGIVFARLRFEAWATSRTAANAITARLRPLLHHFRGVLNGTTVVQHARIDDRQAGYEPPQHAGKAGLRVSFLDILFTYQES